MEHCTAHRDGRKLQWPGNFLKLSLVTGTMARETGRRGGRFTISITPRSGDSASNQHAAFGGASGFIRLHIWLEKNLI